MYYSFQLLDNPDQPGATNFYANLQDAYSTAHLAEPLPVAIRMAKLLSTSGAFAPVRFGSGPSARSTAQRVSTPALKSLNGGTRVGSPSNSTLSPTHKRHSEEGKTDGELAKLRLAALRRATFPYRGLSADHSNVEEVPLPPQASTDSIADPTTASNHHAVVASDTEVENGRDSPHLPADLAVGVRLFKGK